MGTATLAAPSPLLRTLERMCRIASQGTLVTMHVMDVRYVCMGMPVRQVNVRVAVRPMRHRIMTVIVVRVVMGMSVLMLKKLVHVLVAVRLGEMQRDTGEHDQAAHSHPDAQGAVAQGDGDQCTDEWRGSEYGARTCCTKRTLSEQIEAQTEPVSGRANDEKRHGGRWTRQHLSRCIREG